MMTRKWILGVLTILMVAGCAAPQPTRLQPTPAAAAAVPTATRARAARATPTPTPEATATATALPTVAPSVTATAAPTATPSPSPTAMPADAAVQPAPKSSVASGVLLAIDPRKYPAPALLTPYDNTTYHVAQPVVHLAWSATPTDLMVFGQTPGCVSDATNFRRAFESYQLVIHSLDARRADQVQWTDNGATFDLNLTTVPQGRYAWSVSVVTLCESYVAGQRNDLPQHKSTLQRTYLGPVSPTSATRIINWVP